MKTLAVLALFVCGAFAQYGGYSSYQAPVEIRSNYAAAPVQHIPISRFNQDIRGSEHNQFDFETGHGIRHQEATVIKGHSNEGPIISKTGSVSYTSPEGIPISLSYSADENGFHASGSHLPVHPENNHMKAEMGALYDSIAREHASIAAYAPARQEAAYSSYSPPPPPRMEYQPAPIRVDTYSPPPPPPPPRISYSPPPPPPRQETYAQPIIRVESYAPARQAYKK